MPLNIWSQGFIVQVHFLTIAGLVVKGTVQRFSYWKILPEFSFKCIKKIVPPSTDNA